MQDVAKQAVREYVESHSRQDLLRPILDEELPRYAEALDRLGERSTSPTRICSISDTESSAKINRFEMRDCLSLRWRVRAQAH